MIPARLVRFSFLSAMTALLHVSSMAAQSVSTEPVEQGCGSLAVARLDLKESIRRTEAKHPEWKNHGGMKQRARIAGGYIERQFWVQSFADQTFRQVEASLLYEGKLVRIWVDNVDTASISPETIAIMARALDTATPSGSRDPNKGIVRNNQDVFGPPPVDYQLDEATDFLLSDIITGAVNFVGFFSPSDQMPITENPYSNAMNLLYVDAGSARGDIQSLLGIIAHEHQHLIHYGRNPGSRSFYNEGCSELASIINGYRFRGRYSFIANTNVDLLRWTRIDDPGLVGADYERAMAFHYYLYEQFGERFIYELVGAVDVSLGRINIALERTGHGLSYTNWTNVVRDFAAANWVRHHPIRAYGYTFVPSPDEPPVTERSFEGPVIGATGKVTLARAASIYHLYENPGVLRVGATGTRAFRIMAMVFRGSEVEVLDMAGEPEIVLGRWGARADRIVVAYVNLSEDANDVSWHAESITVGVPDNTLYSRPSSLDLW